MDSMQDVEALLIRMFVERVKIISKSEVYVWVSGSNRAIVTHLMVPANSVASCGMNVCHVFVSIGVYGEGGNVQGATADRERLFW